MVASSKNPQDLLDREQIDDALAALDAKKHTWARMQLGEKLRLLDTVRVSTLRVAARWVQAAIEAKGIPEGDALAGEEWLSGPWGLIEGVKALSETLRALQEGRNPLADVPIRTRPDGQVIADVYPVNVFDNLLMNGVRAEVWMQPGVTTSNLREHTASFYKQTQPEGKVALILGAGNIASIPPLDMLYKLFIEGEVVVVKMNPVNDYLGPFLEEVFAAFVDDDYVRFVYGGITVGKHLTNHPLVETLHVTGSERTHDAIIFGVGEEGARRKAADAPINLRPMSSELGGVGPTIVVPGPWTAADLAFQAEHIATQKFHNGGFNCIASQVLILPESWSKSNAFLQNIEQTFTSLPPRHPYYPGTADRLAAVRQAHPEATVIDADSDAPRLLIRDLDPNDENEYCFQNEFFAGALAQTALPGENAETFLRNAITFANERLHGTLGASIIIHPQTRKELGSRFEALIADLKYGAIGINAWSGVAFLMSRGTWGAFPGHPRNDIQSGSGVVHNGLMFDKPQKTVVYAPFAPFPRNLLAGEWTILPRPPWYVTHKQGHEVGRLLTTFAAEPQWRQLPAIFAAALRG